jgi:hypothetical protein
MIDKGANHWNRGLTGACHAGHQTIAQLMIKKGATRCCRCRKTLEEHAGKHKSPQ